MTQAVNPSIESYKDSWANFDQNTIDAMLDSMHVNVINVSFATFSPSGDHTFTINGVEATPEQLKYFIEKAHEKGIQVKIAIGGATYGLSGMLKTPEDAQGMASAISDFINQYGFDGVDLDIEDYPAVNLQIDLIKDLRTQLGPDKLISYTAKAPASTTQPYADVIKRAYNELDGINIMAYDYGPGYDYKQDVQTLINWGVPPQIIKVGLMPGYDDMGTYTSKENIEAAAEYAKDQGLGGVMTWDLDRDYTNQDGLGQNVATNTIWDTFHSSRMA
jgi:GH18 family chitinase